MLRAPEAAVGKMSQCPGCGAMVTCPEPVYEAEVVLVTPKKSPSRNAPPQASPPKKSAATEQPRVNPFADLDDDKPYALVNPPPAAEASTESRRPCPICGEMILSSAVKCRFCGEIFDAVLKRDNTKKPRKSGPRRAASDDGSGVRDLVIGFVSFAIGFGATLVSFANPSADDKGGGQFVVFYGLILGGIVGILRGIWTLARSSR
jgi:hypothetical protein